MQDDELKGRSVSWVKCHQAVPVPFPLCLSCSVTVNNRLPFCCWGTLKHQTSWWPDHGQSSCLCNVVACKGIWNRCDSANKTEANKKHCNWALLLAHFVYWSWHLDSTQKALLFDLTFFSCDQRTIHIFGVKENENREWIGGLWRVVSECADDKLGMANIERAETERSYLCCAFWSRLWERDRP